MAKLIVDASMRAKLNNLDELSEICDQSGQTLGYFYPTVVTSGSENETLCPFSIEEIERRRKQRTGRPLREILENLDRS